MTDFRLFNLVGGVYKFIVNVLALIYGKLCGRVIVESQDTLYEVSNLGWKRLMLRTLVVVGNGLKTNF